MPTAQPKITKRQIAEFRFSILGQIFARPPEKGALAERLRELSQAPWLPPGSLYPETYSVRTLERWYSVARKSPHDPVSALLPTKRCDAGIRRALNDDHMSWLRNNFHRHRRWSWQLHADNLSATEFQPTPSYATVLRWMRAQGYFPEPSNGQRRKNREILSFESAFPGELWHFDGHVGSRMILDKNGEYKRPHCIAFIDDYSRLCCHCQWVNGESAEEIVHIFTQAILKRGLPRKVMSDNGSGMIAAEFEDGVKKLAVIHERTLPRSAYQNGKIESFWKPMEARLLAMLENVKPLTLEILNTASQAWVEQEYNASVHSETKEKPLNRFLDGKSVIRQAPSYEYLRRAFRMCVPRRQRRSDGTFTLDGVRFQVPTRFRHLENLTLAYARWDLSRATILDPDTLLEIEDTFPLNKVMNSSMKRKPVHRFQPPLSSDSENENLPPLLQRYLQKQASESFITGYIPLEKEVHE